jgi:hypothetical protein
MSRGGKRAGAGRRGHGLTLKQVWAVGGEYERVANGLRDEQAWDEYKRSTQGEDIADLRADVLDGDEPVDREALDYLEEEMDKLERRVELRHVRGYKVNKRARDAAIEWCRDQYKVTISKSKADECHKAFRALISTISDEG